MRRLLIAILPVAGLALGAAAPKQIWGLDPSPMERAAIADFGRCVVNGSPAKAHSVLTIDFRTKAYRDGMKVLARVNESCFTQGRRMRAGGLPFAAAMNADSSTA